MQEDAARLLCLYALIGNPTECKLAAIRGTRAYDKFWDQCRPFAFNPLVPLGEQRAQEVYGGFLQYIHAVQVAYYHTLKKAKIDSGDRFDDAEGKGASVKIIRANHRILCEMDQTEWRDDYEQLSIKATSGSPIKYETQLREYSKLFALSYTCFVKLVEKLQNYEFDGKPLSMDQRLPIGEVLAFLTHLSRSVVFLHRDKKEKSDEDSDAAVRHCKRAILDIHKAIIVSSFHLHWDYKANFSIPDVQSYVRNLAKVRATEVSLSANDDEKTRMYVELVCRFLGLHGVSGDILRNA